MRHLAYSAYGGFSVEARISWLPKTAKHSWSEIVTVARDTHLSHACARISYSHAPVPWIFSGAVTRTQPFSWDKQQRQQQSPDPEWGETCHDVPIPRRFSPAVTVCLLFVVLCCATSRYSVAVWIEHCLLLLHLETVPATDRKWCPAFKWTPRSLEHGV